MANLFNFQFKTKLEILPSLQSNPVSIPTKEQPKQHGTLFPLTIPHYTDHSSLE